MPTKCMLRKNMRNGTVIPVKEKMGDTQTLPRTPMQCNLEDEDINLPLKPYFGNMCNSKMQFEFEWIVCEQSCSLCGSLLSAVCLDMM